MLFIFDTDENEVMVHKTNQRGTSTSALSLDQDPMMPEEEEDVAIKLEEEEEIEEQRLQEEDHELDYLKEGGIDWLHIPKTGTSLGNLVVLFACPELPEGDYVLENAVKNVPNWCLDRFRINEIHRSFLPLADHFSLANRTEDQLRRVFTMLRKPLLRVTSGYHYVRGYKKPNATAAELCNYFKWTKRIHEGFYGMTKVILGYHLGDIRKGLPTVASTSRPSDAEIQEAIRRVNVFAFAGVTDYWKTSECIFNNKFMAYSRKRSDIVSRHYRSKPKSVSYPSKYPCHDGVDEQVFQAALRRLIRESIENDCYDVFLQEMSDTLI